MCLIVDTCAVHLVFGPASDNDDFKPIKEWIVNGPGKMIWGGTTYISEIKKLSRFTKLFAEFKRSGKIAFIDSSEVDKIEKKFMSIERKSDFDDPHIVALAVVSRCRVICTTDKRADKFIKDRRFYKKLSPPSIYRDSSHKHLLCEKNIVAVCK